MFFAHHGLSRGAARMAKITFKDSQEQVEFSDEEDSPIAEACENAGVPFACTEGVCGTCVIEVVHGMEHLTPFTKEEGDFLGEPCHERLACQCKIKKGGHVTLTF